ncbi:TetR/AcrR family transcriptional regulator [Rhizobium sp. S152]|uniref:TetR/AcrR family transcriptional regulator n=1 Tax=Rhizobium sp. S152 TaxID=3055038 RepID=UPI0025A98119|nr:TetR/AcrR family transcriptional regulator [Rhizobium sp. S152]MDM9628506.1 TetR/AcrR family transcriptional regulator [Rhizobium sp. S152]
MTPELESQPKRGKGRPKSFQRDEALKAAMKLFWDRGYEGTSFDDLITAMNISASSFSNSFKNKEALYREATDAYLAASGEWFLGILTGEPEVATAFKKLFETTAVEFTRADLPAGCMISLAGTHLPPSLSPVRDMMAQHRAVSESAMLERLKRGVADGQIAPGTDIESLAAFFNALARGMAVKARDGADRDHLLKIAGVAMKSFPSARA